MELGLEPQPGGSLSCSSQLLCSTLQSKWVSWAALLQWLSTKHSSANNLSLGSVLLQGKNFRGEFCSSYLSILDISNAIKQVKDI